MASNRTSRSQGEQSGLGLVGLGALLPVLAASAATAPVALAAGRVLAFAGASLILGILLVLRLGVSTPESTRRRLASAGLGLLGAGLAGEGLARLVARPLSFAPYPVVFALSLFAIAVVVYLRRREVGVLVASLSVLALGVIATSITGFGLDSSGVIAGSAASLLPVLAGALVTARALGAGRLPVPVRIGVALGFLTGFGGIVHKAAGFQINEDMTVGARSALLVSLAGAALAALLLVLPRRMFASSAATAIAAVPLALAMLSSSASALLPLERSREEGIAVATDVVSADLQLTDGMIAEIGAGPRSEFRGLGFYDCDRLNSRDCFITHYDDIALRQGVAAAVDDLVEKVKNNQGATFPAHCHQVVHNLGQMAFQLADEFDAAAALDPQVCGTGYTHGLWEQQFEILGTDAMFTRTGSLCQELNMVSDWYKWTCHHILGHLMAAKLAADPGRAVEYCNNVTDPQGFTDCQTGGWMNFFQDDTVIAKMRASGSLEDLFGVCWGASDSTKFFCYQELFPVIYSMLGDDYAAGRACLDYSEPARGSGYPWTVEAQNFTDRCIQGLARGIGASSAQNYMLMRDRCLMMPEEAHDPCLTAAAASYVLNTGGATTAFEICKVVKDQAYREYCYFWTKHARKLLANGPNSENLPDDGEVRLPENAFLPDANTGVLIQDPAALGG